MHIIKKENLEIVKELEHRRDELCNELQIVGYSIISDSNMPITIKELRVIRANAIEHEIGLLTNRIVELHEPTTLRITCIGEDDSSHKLYRNVDNQSIYVLVDDWYYTITPDGEPECPLRRDLNVVIIEKGEDVDGR